MKLIAAVLVAVASTAPASDRQFRLSNVYAPGGDGFLWTIFVDEPPEVLGRIKCVEYTLYPSYPNPNHQVCTRETQFLLTEKAWEEFNVVVRFFLSDGTTTVQSYMLDLHSPSRRGTRTVPQSSLAPPTIRDPKQLFKGTQPGGLAFLSSGLVILDTYNDALLEAATEVLATIPTGILTSPIGIASARSGGRDFILLIQSTPSGDSVVTAYTTTGKVWKSWPAHAGRFSSIASDPTNSRTYLAITSYADFSLVELPTKSIADRSNRPFSPVATTSTVGYFRDAPSGPVAIDSGNHRLFVADAAGGLFVVDTNGTQGHWPRLPLKRGLGRPRALIYDPKANRLYVGAGKHLLTLQFQSALATPMVSVSASVVSEILPGHFRNVTALAIDAGGRLWVGDSDARTLSVISTAGAITQVLP